MTARPWMPLYIGDYLADTAHLTATEHGAYLLMLMHQWQHGMLPSDDELLTRIARVHPPHWPRVKRVLISFFETQEDGSWKNKRLAAERDKASDLSQKRAKAARQKHIISKAIAGTSDNAIAEQKHTHARGLPQSQSQREVIDLPSEGPPDNETSDAKRAIEIYNIAAGEVGWPLVQRSTAPRLTALRARLRECCGIVGWQAAIDKAKASPFLCGENDRGWKADFDFLCKSNHFTKLMEGGYDRTAGSTNGAGARPHETVLRSIARVVEKRAGMGGGKAGADGPPAADGIPPPAPLSLADDLEIPAGLRRY